MRLSSRCAAASFFVIFFCRPGPAAELSLPAAKVLAAPASGAVETKTADEWCELAESRTGGSATASDLAEVAGCFRRAAELGSVRAMTALGRLHRDGRLGRRDYWEARRWFEQAAAAGDPTAQRELGLMLRDGLCGQPLLAKGFEWLERAARSGDGAAQYEVGRMLCLGQGIERDPEEGEGWFQLALENGEGRGQFGQAMLLLDGLGRPRDRVRAFELLFAAAERVEGKDAAGAVARCCKEATPDEKARLQAILRARLEPSKALICSGSYLDCCLAALEQLEDEAAVRGFLERLAAMEDGRAGWLAARQAYAGRYGAPDPARVRRCLQAARATHPVDGARLLAMLDSVVAETPALRQEAHQHLVAMAEQGDVEAAVILAQRMQHGIGEEANPAAAERFYRMVEPRAAMAAGVLPSLTEWQRLVEKSPVAPPPAELKRLVAAAAKTQGRGRDLSPVPVFRLPPGYPFELRRMEVEGEATVEFVVDAEGRTRDVRTVKSTHPLFAAAAEGSVRQWRFAPGKRKGRRVNVLLQQPVSFRLQD